MNNRIREVREELGMSRVDFGERIGVSGDVINNLERGRIDIKEERIKLICSTFNVSENWLRTGKGEMHTEPDIEFSDICFKIGVHDEKAKNAIINYWKLSESDKELVWKFLDMIRKAGD